MAEKVASDLIKSVLPLIVEEAISLYGVKDQIDRAKGKLEDMYMRIRNAETQLSAENEMLYYFVLKLREAVNDVEDVVATYLSSGWVQRRVNVVMIHRVRSEIEQVLERLSKLWSDVFELQKLETLRENERERSLRERERRETFGHNIDVGVVGFEEKINQLVAHLTSTQNHDRVVAISGMGGLGKTTLAREVYNHSRVREHFARFGWAYVSRQFQAKREVWETLLFDLMDSPSEEQKADIKGMTDNQVSERLYSLLKDNKCLVVLDDIWASETWGNLKAAFPVEIETNSKILVTTRNKQAAWQPDKYVFRHELGCLGDDKSWELFMNKANFGRLDATVDRRKLEKLGREMVKHCAGLPLAIELLGGILSQRPTISEWEKVHRNAKTYINEGGIGHQDTMYSSVSWVLSLSYLELPCQLKPCFLYLAHFPEGLKIINVKELCQMWIAEGLVLTKENQLEDTAYDYFRELVGRYMVQTVGQNLTGKPKTCRVHDLIRDFCLSKAEKENFLEIVDLRNKHRLRDFELPHDKKHVPKHKVRRLVINLNNNVSDELHPIIEKNDRCLRSFICFNPIRLPSYDGKTMKLLFNRFALLRILKFNNYTPAKFEKLPKEIGNLIYLRLLSMRKSHVRELPSSIGKLRSLLNLDLQIISSVRLPNVIGNLEQLRHLYLPAVYNVKGQRLRLHKLQKLQTLVNVSTSWCDLNDLVQLTSLKKLKICVDTKQELKVPKDSTFEQLESLAISASTMEHLEPVDIEPLISICPKIVKLQVELPILRLPEVHLISSLRKLTLRHTQLHHDPMLVLERLQGLQILVLGTNAFSGNEMVCSRGGFSRLESLSLVELKHLDLWTVMDGAVPSLRHLHIEDCSGLREVPNGLRHVSTLKKMVIKGMSEAFCWRVRRGEDSERVQHVHSVEFLHAY